MREIKFRAWCSLDNKMIDPMELPELILQNKVKMTKKDIENYITFMQSTGLKDKNDKEIYEGDIVKPVRFASWIGAVEFSEESAAFILNDHDNKFRMGENVYLSQFVDGLEVIGNIYETPELLEREEQ